MLISHPFGRTPPVPPKVVVEHGVRLRAAAEAIIAAGPLSPQEGEALADAVAARNNLSLDRVRMLVDRLKPAASTPVNQAPAH